MNPMRFEWQLSQYIRSECCDAPVVQVEIFISLRYPTWCIKCNRRLAMPTGDDLWDMEAGNLPRGVLSNEDMDRFVVGMTAALKHVTHAFTEFASTLENMHQIKFPKGPLDTSLWEDTWKDPQSED